MLFAYHLRAFGSEIYISGLDHLPRTGYPTFSLLPQVYHVQSRIHSLLLFDTFPPPPNVSSLFLGPLQAAVLSSHFSHVAQVYAGLQIKTALFKALSLPSLSNPYLSLRLRLVITSWRKVRFHTAVPL